MDIAEIVGIGGVIATTSALLPQVIKTFKEKSVEDLSVFMLIMLLINSSLWITYGILKNAEAITWANVVFFLNTLMLFFLKIKHGKKKAPFHNSQP